MSELLTTRIREGAGRLRLANLEEQLDTLVERAEAATMGYLEFVHGHDKVSACGHSKVSTPHVI